MNTVFIYKGCEARKVTNQMLLDLGWMWFIQEYEEGKPVEEYRCRHFKSVIELKDFINRHPELECNPQ